MPNKEDYKSWDYFQRNVKSNALIDSYPSIKNKILRVMDEVEKMLDGPNEDFEQNKYLKKKTELQKLIRSIQNPDSIRKAS
tara:strand:+ start:3579 stop:3821 length:243 start_codon:yes stop_codon:yes gene_type:complete